MLSLFGSPFEEFTPTFNIHYVKKKSRSLGDQVNSTLTADVCHPLKVLYLFLPFILRLKKEHPTLSTFIRCMYALYQPLDQPSVNFSQCNME